MGALELKLLAVTAIAVAVVVPAMLILRWKRYELLIRLCPREIFLIETADARKRLVADSRRAFYKQRGYWIFPLAYGAATALIVLPFAYLTGMICLDGEMNPIGVNSGRRAIVTLLAMLPAGVMFFVSGARRRRWTRVFVREYLNAHGVPICMSCGYDLRGQVNQICPECGRSAANAEVRGEQDDTSSRG